MAVFDYFQANVVDPNVPDFPVVFEVGAEVPVPELDTFTVTVEVSPGWGKDAVNRTIAKYLIAKILNDQTVDYNYAFSVKSVERA